ncbi:MAG TPA: hypothetical protein VFR31_00635 [Thermoanaerobaculia bacterium]|nr:hypothetical protein [Thermoanaerobaculia bacterium]
MAWISATTFDGRNANLHSSLIAAILDRVQGDPRAGSEILFAAGASLEVRESPAQLLREIETGEQPESPSAAPDIAW